MREALEVLTDVTRTDVHEFICGKGGDCSPATSQAARGINFR